MSFLAKCPQCGHRFHVKLEEKSITGTERVSYPNQQQYRTRSGEPETYDIQDYRYTYKCEHCGHEWSETAIKEELEKDRP